MTRIKVIQYDGTEMIYDALSFELRTNQVSNWLKITFGETEFVILHDVCAIKTISS